MNYIKIIDAKDYMPRQKVYNDEIEKKFNLEEGYISKRTGIKERYYAGKETIENMALEAVKKLGESNEVLDVDLIIVATTSSKSLMPGISNYIQKELNINPCICLDILAGCSGFINAFDIAKIYIETGKVKKALVVGVDLLSDIVDESDLGTVAVLSDGAAAVLLEACSEKKSYFANIRAEKDEKNILYYKTDSKIYMDGKEVYKYAVKKTVENLEKLINLSGVGLDEVKYIIPHQSNLRIMKAMASRLGIDFNKLYINIDKKGNTFCASVPIAIAEMMEKKLLSAEDKVILLGYGGGLNTGSILLEI